VGAVDKTAVNKIKIARGRALAVVALRGVVSVILIKVIAGKAIKSMTSLARARTAGQIAGAVGSGYHWLNERGRDGDASGAKDLLTGEAMEHSEGFLNIVNDAKGRIRETTPEEVRRKQELGHSFHLVDVREDSEWERGRAQGATHLGKGVIERDIEKAIPDRHAEIVLYCGGGYRSALAADALQKMGYTNVLSMDGGWKRWRELDYPVEAD
jgi:rhodanese-related sulfurtransferase